MADITSKVIIKGGYNEVNLPFGWKVWEVTVPAAALASGDNEITLPDRFDADVRILDVRAQTLDASDAGTSLTLDIENAKVAISGGAMTPISNLLAGINLKTAGLSTFVASGATVLEDLSDDADIIAGTHKGAINLELALSGATSATTKFLVAALMGRIEY